VTIKESDDRSRQIQDLFYGHEFRVELGHLWSGAESTAEKDSESAPAFACCRPKADVVNSQCGVIFGAPFESDLDLAAHVLVVLVAHEITKQSVGVRGDVERFGRRGAGAITRGDVADCVAASFSRGHASGSEKTQQVGRLFEFHVIQLCVLASREMYEATAEAICGIAEQREVVRGEVSTR